ncbi:hypothetical protein LBJG_01648 [Lactobacillus jensenii 1153]|nr:hypothetical protein LBJG_01648 [Lactobacillus jensenii 1153]
MEQRIISNTIDNFVKAIEESKIKAQLLIVTTNKEKKLIDSDDTTYEVVKKNLLLLQNTKM